MADDSVSNWAGDLLIEAFRSVDPAMTERAAAAHTASAWEALTSVGCPDAEIMRIACDLYGIARANMAELGPAQAALLPHSLATRYNVVALSKSGGVLDVACANPLDPSLEQALAFACGARIHLALASPSAIREAQRRVYVEAASGGVEWVRGQTDKTMVVAPTQGTAVDMLDRIILDALLQRASDIHIEPADDGTQHVRYRSDGVLYNASRVPEKIAPYLMSRIKVLAGLDIADRVRPQDGRATVKFERRTIDLRISTLPLGGTSEKAVIRVLDGSATALKLDVLGFLPSERRTLDSLLSLSEGLILVTGPTGSGKTTTLYTALQHVKTGDRNIVTVEDPIEYRLPGVNQVQVNTRSSLTFAAALRSILRQDPDVVLVGEIRNAETAEIAIKASMTGHLVFSTLHTNDAPSAAMRMLDIGAEPGALASALKAVVSQRLVRRLCRECSRPAGADEFAAEQLQLLAGCDVSGLRSAVGCPACRGSGYRGRVVVPEIFRVTPEIEAAISKRSSAVELRTMALRGTMKTLWQAGLARVADGTTSLPELLDNIAHPMIEEVGPTQVDADGGASTSQAAVDALFAQIQGRTPAPTSTARELTGQRVLVIDEDRSTRKALRTALEHVGCRVIEALDGEAGLAYARYLRPDVVITELALARLDGIGLLQALSTELAVPKVILYTAQDDKELHDWARQLGAVEVFTKRSEPRQVAASLSATTRHLRIA